MTHLTLLGVTFAPRRAPTARRAWLLDLVAIGALGLATVGFFWRLIFTNVYMPAGGGDLAGFIFPTYSFAAEWWRRGVIPLWNPHLFAGMSFVGDIQAALFYPFNLLTFFLSNPLTYRDLELLAVFHFFLAGAGMYALLRHGVRPPTADDQAPTGARGLSIAACLAGALAFEFSDLFITHFGNLNLIAAAAWLPLVFLFFSRALDERKPGFAALGGIFLALAFFAGHIQSFLFILLVVGLYALYRALAGQTDGWRIARTLGLTLAVGLGLSAITLLPAIEMTRSSVRSAFAYEQAAQYSLPPAELIGLFAPGFFGRGPQAAWGPWQRVEVGYIGVFPLVLAALALVLRRNSKTHFFALLALVGLLLALGGYGILHGWLYAFVPGFGQLRAPARFIFVMDFALAVLAAIGFDALAQAPSDAGARALRVVLHYAPWIFLILALSGGGLALGILILGQGQDPALFARIANAANALAFFILLLASSLVLLFAREKNLLTAPLWSALALALIFFDLFSLGAYVDLGLSDPTLAYRREDVVAFLQSDASFYRIDSRTDVEGTWLSDTALFYNLYDVNGDNPLVLSNWERYWESLGGRGTRAYDLLSIKYVLARRGTPLDAKFTRVFDGASGISVYENRAALPRAWVVYASRVIPEPARALEAVRAADFNPRAVAILEKGAPGETSALLPSDDARIVGYGPNEIDLEVSARQDGYLVLSEVYYPGWRAFVDERAVQVLRADYLLRAVPLSAGAQRVRVVYEPWSFKLGAGVSGGMAVGLAAWAVWRRKVTTS